MILNKLIIFDYSNEKAGLFEFSETSNIICSDSSTTGKSCLIKSIFYTLGFDVKTFPQGWPHKNMLFKLIYTNGAKKGFIIRKNDLFFVDNHKEAMNESDYSKWLLDELNLNVKLPLRVNGDLHFARPSATLLPFYIDQDNSWSGGVYKATTPSLSMYSSQSIPKNIIEYILGIGNDKIVELEENKQTESRKKDEYAKQVGVLYDLKDKFIDNQQNTVSFDVDEIKGEVKKYLYYASKLNEEIKVQKTSIYVKKVKLDALKVDKEELNKLLRETEHHYKNIECKCTQCGSQLTREQSINRMKLNNNKYEIDCFKLEIDKQIKELESKINSEIKELKINNDNYEKFLNISNEKRGEITLKEYVNDIANSKFTNNYLELRDKIQLAKDACESNIKRLQAEINNLKQQQEIKKDDIRLKFENIISDLNIKFPNANLTNYKFLDFKTIKDSGAAKNQIYFGLYMAYVHLILSLSNVELPLGFDSPIKDELDENILGKFYAAIEKYILKTNKQSFVVMINDKLKFLKEKDNYNIISLSKPILKNIDLLEVKKEFSIIFDS